MAWRDIILKFQCLSVHQCLPPVTPFVFWKHIILLKFKTNKVYSKACCRMNIYILQFELWHSRQDSNTFSKTTFGKLNKSILQFAKIHFSGKIHGFDKIQNFNGCSVQSPMSASCHTLCVPTKYISWDSAFLETLYINQIYILNYCEEGQSRIVVLLTIEIFSAYQFFSGFPLIPWIYLVVNQK